LAGNSAAPVKFSRLKYFPAHTKETAERFVSLFHRYAYIYRPFGSGAWISANEQWSLTDTEILKAIACVHPKAFIGTRSGKASKYAVLDIDAGSRYHTREGLQKITSLLEKAGISEHNLYRSSESGGWHLYIFFDAPVSSKDLHRQLYHLLKLHDFEVAKGTLEIFPHPGENSVGQGLRLPLQPGFAWLNSNSLAVSEERDELSPAEALNKFVNDMECNVNPYHQFHRLKAYVEQVASTKQVIVARAANSTRMAEIIPIRRDLPEEGSAESIKEVKSVFKKLPPGIKCDVWLRGRQYYNHGLSGPSQRADAVLSLSHYLFYGDPERMVSPLGYGYEDERKWLMEELLRAKHHGQSKDISAGHSDGLKQIERAAKWVPPHRRGQEARKYEFEVPISWVKNNANRLAKARQKIAVAVEDFEEAGLPFSMRDLMLKSGCGVTTVRKHADLWKTAYERLQSSLLAGDPHDYNAGVQATAKQSQPAAPLDPKIMPPGRLAARRIVYELKMRDQRQEAQKHEAAVRAEKGLDQEWRDRVNALLKKDLSGGSPAQLKIQINLLARELLIAPSEEDWRWLSGYISSLKEQLLACGQSVQLVIGLMPPAS
jgi:hypothetical protein